MGTFLFYFNPCGVALGDSGRQLHGGYARPLQDTTTDRQGWESSSFFFFPYFFPFLARLASIAFPREAGGEVEPGRT